MVKSEAKLVFVPSETRSFTMYGPALLYVWLGLAALAGLCLLRNERTAFRANTLAAMHGEQPLLRGLFDSGRKVLAGMLFLLPGVLSDVMALALLALRFNLGREFAPSAVAGGDFHRGPKSIDGEFRRLD